MGAEYESSGAPRVVGTLTKYVYANSADTVGAAPCPWDCGDVNGTVGVPDLLALLSQWGQNATSCDIDLFSGVGVSDLLELLSNWGPC